MAFSPNSRTLASGGDDGTVRLWDLATGQQIGTALTLSSSGAVWSVAFSPDGKTLASGGGAAVVDLWDVSYLRNFATYLCTLAGRSLTRTEWQQYVSSEPAYQRVCPA